MLWLALLALMGSCIGFFIPGPGCGTAQNEIKVMDKLPEDPTELAALFCVMTEDYEGYKRWRDAIPGLCLMKYYLCIILQLFLTFNKNFTSKFSLVRKGKLICQPCFF